MVNTFTVCGDPYYNAKMLDWKILNKQITEISTIVKALEEGAGYSNHTATKMWDGYIPALKLFNNICYYEYISRGYKVNDGRLYQELLNVSKEDVLWPWWYSWEKLHLTHRASLLRKNYDYYSCQFNLSQDQQYYYQLGYIWPTKLYYKYIVAFNYNFFDCVNYIISLSANELCDPMGKGAPPQFRWSREEALKWVANKNVNPRTGRKIVSTKKGSVYDELSKTARYHCLIT